MCGVIGIELNGIEDEDISLIYKIFLQTMIRGKHATGISYRKGSKIITIKENLSADNFLKIDSSRTDVITPNPFSF